MQAYARDQGTSFKTFRHSKLPKLFRCVSFLHLCVFLSWDAFLSIFCCLPPFLFPSPPVSLTPTIAPQGGCSSETRTRSTQPFDWPYSCTTPAPTPRRRLSTWFPMWTTLRQRTASPWPTPVSMWPGDDVFSSRRVGQRVDAAHQGLRQKLGLIWLLV